MSLKKSHLRTQCEVSPEKGSIQQHKLMENSCLLPKASSVWYSVMEGLAGTDSYVFSISESQICGTLKQ